MPLFDLTEFFKLSSALNYNLSAASLNRYNVLMYITDSKRLDDDGNLDRQKKSIVMEALDYLFRRGSFAERPVGNPVVILLDLKMPKLDGIQVLQQLRADEHMRFIPVVVLTSSRESLDLKECYKLGVNAYVVKPVRFQKFVESVKQVGVFWALINEPPPGYVKRH